MLQRIHRCLLLLLPCLSSSHLPSEQTMVLLLLLLLMWLMQILAWVQSSFVAMLSLRISLVLLSSSWVSPPHLSLLGVLWHLLAHPCLVQPILPLMEMTQSQSRLHLLQLLVMMMASCLHLLAQVTR